MKSQHILLVFCSSGWLFASSTSAIGPAEQPVTFTKDIAPILFNHCAVCHRPGQPGPFSLLDYNDARKRAKQIAEVTTSRYMPPWLPEPGYGEFADSRRL